MTVCEQPALARSILVNAITIGLIAVVGLGALWGVDQYWQFRTSAAIERAELISERRSAVRDDVRWAVALIEAEREQTEAELHEQLRERVNAALAAVRGAETALGPLPRSERQRVAVQLLGPISYEKSRGYLFAFDKAGVTTLHPDPTLIGNSPRTQPRRDGGAITALYEFSRHHRSGFVAYDMKGEDGVVQRKLAYLHDCETLDWTVGSAAWSGDFESSLQRAVLSKLEHRQPEAGTYFFAGTWDGTSLLGPARGKNMLDTTDANGTKVVKELIAAAQSGGGFVEYVMPGLEGQRSEQKLSYVAAVPEWQWYVGAGIYVGDIETLIESRQRALAYRLWLHIAYIGAAMVLLAAIATWLARRYAARLARNVRQLEEYFGRAAAATVPPEREPSDYCEFSRIAAAAEEMVRARAKAEGERRAIEDQLRQAQKLEALGRLTGGVAHDFNNMLTGISGAAQELELELDGNPDLLDLASLITTTAHRAAGLNAKLLAFSRKAPLAVQAVDASEIVRQVASILRHSVDRLIEIELELPDQPCWARADGAQLQSALLNLGINARDAMPDGGRIVLRAEVVEVHANSPGPFIATPTPGRYVRLSVKDDGTGMDAETQTRAFEPFYTTKEASKGTGLGLAAVYGTVRELGGGIALSSQVGQGTEVALLLPWTASAVGPTSSGPLSQPRGRGRVLVIDDEAPIRRVLGRMLAREGFEVEDATDGVEGLERLRGGDGHSLVLLDLNMPRMSGREVLRRLREDGNEVPVIVMTGYSDTVSEVADDAVTVLQKPFSRNDALASLKRALPGATAT